MAGALFLGIIAVLPQILGPHVFQGFFEWIVGGKYAELNVSGLEEYFAQLTQSEASSLVSIFSFGGTTLLIVVGVAIETFRELEAQLTMRNYKGFLN